MSTIAISPGRSPVHVPVHMPARMPVARATPQPQRQRRSAEPRQTAAGRATRRPSGAGRVRLTRRGRVVLVIVALAAVLVAGFFLGAGSVATQERGASPATEVVMVAPGETLWDIASGLTPTDGDVRDTMYDIKRLNALSSSALDAGQRIRVPAQE